MGCGGSTPAAGIASKRGDTLSISALYLSGGTPVNLTGYTILAQMRECGDGGVAATLTPTILDQGTNLGEFTLALTAAVTADLLGDYLVDIQYTDGSSVVRSTETFTISILEDVSRA